MTTTELSPTERLVRAGRAFSLAMTQSAASANAFMRSINEAFAAMPEDTRQALLAMYGDDGDFDPAAFNAALESDAWQYGDADVDPTALNLNNP